MNENDDVEKRWKQIDKFSKEEKAAFEAHFGFIFSIITKIYDIAEDEDNEEITEREIGIFQELIDTFGAQQQNFKDDLKKKGAKISQVMLATIQNINQGLYQKGYITEEEYKGSVVKESSLSEDYKQAVSIRAKKLIINSLSFKLAVRKYMSLNEILSEDGLFYFLDGDKFKALEFGNILLERQDVQENFENAQQAIIFYYQKLPELINSQLVDKDKLLEDGMPNKLTEKLDEQATPKLFFAFNLLKKYDENIKSGKIKDENGDGFKKLQRCVANCTKEIFSKNNDIKKYMENISKFINMYETKDTTVFNSLNSNLKNSIDAMINFFDKEGIIENNISGLDLQQNLSDANISLIEEFWEAFKFFFSHPIAFWYKENKAEYRIKVERFADGMKDRSLSISSMINGTNKQTSVFDLLNDASRILTQLEDNTKDSIL